MDSASRLRAGLAERYELEREIGRGGMATVYLARDLRHGSLVAVKVLDPDLSPLFGGDRFAREIRITAGLQHPNILPVLDSGDADGFPFYTMPFVEGESVASRLDRERPLPVGESLRIASEVVDALAYAHDRGIVHRDIKPENILLAHGHAMLADFGIARALDLAGSERITGSGVALGTALYMSPEQASGERVDGRSDIYSLGCVLYEMLAGSPPFTGSSPQAILARHAVDAVPSLRTVRRTVSPALEGVLTTAMAKVPSDRYPDARAFQAALAAAAAEQARDVSTWTITGTVARRRSRMPAAAAGVALVAAAIAAAVAWRAARPDTALDARRVVVFPLVVAGDLRGSAAAGEDVATMIGNALDRSGPLRWIDGWRLLDPARRADPRSLDARTARALARAERSAYYLTGRVLPRGDSADVLLELNDVAGDSVVARGSAGGLAAEPWRAGLRAVNHVLPALIPGGVTRGLSEAWADRAPGAVASFLLGEAAFRRVRAADALEHYRAAVAADSTFAIAAVRGAQAATWEHRSTEAGALVRVALAHDMPPKYAHFARGYQAFLDGRADSANREFNRALALDPTMAAAWMQIGETYTHLLPAEGNPDALADAAFAEALRLDSTATQMLLHPIEARLRRGRLADAAPMVQRFLAAAPPDEVAEQIRLMDACARRGPGGVAWRAAAGRGGLALLAAARALAAGGGNLPCAEAAYAAVIEGDSGDAGSAARASALVGLVGVLVARGRPDAAAARVAASVARGDGGSSLLMLAAPVAPALAPPAAEVARADAERFGADFVRCPFPERSWILAVYAASLGRGAVAAGIAAALGARTATDTTGDDRLLARAAAAQSALALGDSGAAASALAAVLAEPVSSGSALSWTPGPARGAERLAYARLLLARGSPARARAVADVFDAAEPASYALYLAASLVVRAEAAARMGDAAAASAYRARLAALRAAPTAARRPPSRRTPHHQEAA